MSKTTNIHYDAIIVGSGIFGSALAHTLALDNRKILLVERSFSQPDRIVGEYLQPSGCLALKELQLIDCLDNIDAQTTNGYAIMYKDKTCKMSYPKDPLCNNNSNFTGCSFHHGRFVMNLREKAIKHKNVTPLEATVTELLENKITQTIIGVIVKLKEEELKIYSDLVVVADGCYSRFRSFITNKTPIKKSNFCGYILKDCQLPFNNHGHVVLTNIGPVLMFQISARDTRILVDVKGKLPNTQKLKEIFKTEVLPFVPECVRDKLNNAVNNQTLRCMPTNEFSSNLTAKDGIIIGGDAFNIRHPMTGGGMTVALWDVVQYKKLLSKETVGDFLDYKKVRAQVEKFKKYRKDYSSVINVLASALYSLFQPGENNDLQYLRDGCFDYLSRGGEFSNGPMLFLSGINGNIFYLAFHFIMVCFYTQYQILTSSRNLSSIFKNIYLCLSVFFTGGMVLLPVIFNEYFP